MNMWFFKKKKPEPMTVEQLRALGIKVAVPNRVEPNRVTLTTSKPNTAKLNRASLNRSKVGVIGSEEPNKS